MVAGSGKDEKYEIRFPWLLILWQIHDLVDHGPKLETSAPKFYKGLLRSDELGVSRFIEETHLLRYRMLLIQIRFGWVAWGPLDIPFPGLDT